MLRRLPRRSVPSARAEGPVVVTGGAGAIGHVLVRGFVEDGRTVHVIDNLSSGRRELLARRDGTPIPLRVADLLAPEAWRADLRGASEVWHLAANPDIRKGTSEPRTDLEQGTLATFNVLEAARRADVPRVLFSSSSVVYGRPSVFPTPETYGPLLPESLYGAAKLACEGLLTAYAACYGLSVYIFRFANVIGPGMTHGALYDFEMKLRKDPARLEVLGDGRQAKSYLRTEGCVDAMRFVASHANEPVNVFNLGSTDQVSVRTMAERIVAAHGGTARIEFTGGERGWPGDIPKQLLAVEKLRALGWSPSEGSLEAVDRTIAELVALRG
jgi:UDP-glucose 4-epimerase